MIVIAPPPSLDTFTSAAWDKDTLALSTPSGKLKLKLSTIVIVPVASNPPNSILLRSAVIFPPLKVILPPIKARVCPVSTCKPNSLATERLVIGAGLSRNLNPIGILMVNNGGASGFTALNSKPLLNKTLSAVLAKNEPLTSNLAFSPNKIPFGLIRYKLALPKTPKTP